MRDYVDDYLNQSDKPMSGNVKMVIKLLFLGFVAAAVTDLLKTDKSIQSRLAELIGLLSGLLGQPLIPPRLTLGKLLLVSVGICAVMGVLYLVRR